MFDFLALQVVMICLSEVASFFRIQPLAYVVSYFFGLNAVARLCNVLFFLSLRVSDVITPSQNVFVRYISKTCINFHASMYIILTS